MKKDLAVGILFLIIGLFFSINGLGYGLGTGNHPGPGSLPTYAGLLLLIIGLVISIRELMNRKGETIKQWNFRPVFFVIGGNFIFGLLLGGIKFLNFPSMGLIIAIYITVFFVSGAIKPYRFFESFYLATLLSVFCYIVFIWLLSMSIPAWPKV